MLVGKVFHSASFSNSRNAFKRSLRGYSSKSFNTFHLLKSEFGFLIVREKLHMAILPNLDRHPEIRPRKRVYCRVVKPNKRVDPFAQILHIFVADPFSLLF